MPAPPARSSIFPAGSLAPASAKTLFAEWYDYTVALLGASGTAADARTALGAADDTAVVKLTGTQTVAGVKTFSSSPVLPGNASTALQAVPKQQLDAALLASALAPALFARASTQATTSGTSVDFTGIPSWAQRITIMLDGVSTSGTSNLLFQIGDSGGIEAASYLGAGGAVSTSSAAAANYTTGFGVDAASAAGILSGAIQITKLGGNTWVCSGMLAASNTPGVFLVAGSKTLSATLDRIRITTVGGADTFDAGLANIAWE